jgi:hypothetical protein
MNSEEKELQHLLEENEQLHKSNMRKAQEEGVADSESESSQPSPQANGGSRRQNRRVRSATQRRPFNVKHDGKQLRVLVDESTQGNPDGIEEDVPATVTEAPPGKCAYIYVLFVCVMWMRVLRATLMVLRRTCRLRSQRHLLVSVYTYTYMCYLCVFCR